MRGRRERSGRVRHHIHHLAEGGVTYIDSTVSDCCGVYSLTERVRVIEDNDGVVLFAQELPDNVSLVKNT